MSASSEGLASRARLSPDMANARVCELFGLHDHDLSFFSTLNFTVNKYERDNTLNKENYKMQK